MRKLLQRRLSKQVDSQRVGFFFFIPKKASNFAANVQRNKYACTRVALLLIRKLKKKNISHKSCSELQFFGDLLELKEKKKKKKNSLLLWCNDILQKKGTHHFQLLQLTFGIRPWGMVAQMHAKVQVATHLTCQISCYHTTILLYQFECQLIGVSECDKKTKREIF